MHRQETHATIRDGLLNTELLRLTRTLNGLAVETKQPGEAQITTTPFQQLTPEERHYCWRYASDPAGLRRTVRDSEAVWAGRNSVEAA